MLTFCLLGHYRVVVHFQDCEALKHTPVFLQWKSGQLCGASASPDMLCNIERSIGASNTGKNCNQEWKTVFFELLLQLSFANSCNRATMVEVLRSFQMCTNPLIDWLPQLVWVDQRGYTIFPLGISSYGILARWENWSHKMRMDYENFQYLHVSVFPNRGKPWLIIKQATLYLIILCLLEMQRQILFSKTPFDFQNLHFNFQLHIWFYIVIIT